MFQAIRGDGPKLPAPDLPPAPDPLSQAVLVDVAERTSGATLDGFDDLCRHLAISG